MCDGRDAASPGRVGGRARIGASAVRLVIAEIAPGKPICIIEEASRGVLLGRDTFAAGAIRPQTAAATFAALKGFRQIVEGYGVRHVRAVATSAVREARISDVFLDRVRGRTGFAFEVINEAEESRLAYLAARHALRGHAALKGAWTLLGEVGGGSTSLTLLRRGQEIPLGRVTQMVAIGGDVRLAASQIQEHAEGDGVREIPREAFLAFCDEIERLDDEDFAAALAREGAGVAFWPEQRDSAR